MRIGLARSLTDSTSGGVFQYEIVLLKALGELAKRFPEEFAYLCYHPGDLGILASARAVSVHDMPVVMLSSSPPKQPPRPEDFLLQRPPTPLPFDPNLVNFD